MIRKLIKFLWMIFQAPFKLMGWLFRQIRNFVFHIGKSFKEFFVEEPQEMPVADIIQRTVENPAEILDHLNDLRKHIFRGMLAILIATIFSFAFVSEILDWLAQPLGGLDQLQAIDVTEPVGVVMRVAFMTGLSVALPYVVFEIMLFAAPGLSRKARIVGLFSIPLVAVFFASGAIFAYYIMLPPATDVLINFMGISTLPRPSSYVRFATGLMFWLGISFEFPLFAYVLSAMGVIRPQALAKNWRIAIAVIAFLAAVVTPTVDPVNMLIVMGPLSVLYGLGIIMAYLARGFKKE